MSNPEKQRRIVCAACRQGNKHLVGPRHWDLIMHATNAAKIEPLHHDRQTEEGFMDNMGNFLSRTEAWKVAKAAGQILYRCGGDTADGGTLYSENLY